MIRLYSHEKNENRKKRKEKKSLELRRGNERGFLDRQKYLGLDAKSSRLIFWREINLAGVVKLDPMGLPKWVVGPCPSGPALKIRPWDVLGDTFFEIYVKN